MCNSITSEDPSSIRYVPDQAFNDCLAFAGKTLDDCPAALKFVKSCSK